MDKSPSTVNNFRYILSRHRIRIMKNYIKIEPIDNHEMVDNSENQHIHTHSNLVQKVPLLLIYWQTMWKSYSIVKCYSLYMFTC